MTRKEALQTVRARDRHTGREMKLRVISFACPGEYAVVSPVDDHADLWYIITDYHVNVFEDLEGIVAAPPVVHLFPDAPR